MLKHYFGSRSFVAIKQFREIQAFLCYVLPVLPGISVYGQGLAHISDISDAIVMLLVLAH